MYWETSAPARFARAAANSARVMLEVGLNFPSLPENSPNSTAVSTWLKYQASLVKSVNRLPPAKVMLAMGLAQPSFKAIAW